MTFIGIQPGDARPQLTLKSAQLSPRTLSTDRYGARIALVSTTALLLGGDHVEIGIEVGAGCVLEMVDTAGTVAYNAEGGSSSWTVRITVSDGGLLLWRAEPMVIADGADVTRRTTIELAPTAVACLRETLVLGRAGEQGGAVHSRTRVNQAGNPLLAEDLDLTDSELRKRPGILGGHRVIDTVSLFGRRAESGAGERFRLFQLAGEGTVGRFLGSELHRSSAPTVFADWRASVRNSDLSTLS